MDTLRHCISSFKATPVQQFPEDGVLGGCVLGFRYFSELVCQWFICPGCFDGNLAPGTVPILTVVSLPVFIVACPTAGLSAILYYIHVAVRQLPSVSFRIGALCWYYEMSYLVTTRKLTKAIE